MENWDGGDGAEHSVAAKAEAGGILHRTCAGSKAPAGPRMPAERRERRAGRAAEPPSPTATQVDSFHLARRPGVRPAPAATGQPAVTLHHHVVDATVLNRDRRASAVPSSMALVSTASIIMLGMKSRRKAASRQDTSSVRAASRTWPVSGRPRMACVAKSTSTSRRRMYSAEPTIGSMRVQTASKRSGQFARIL